MSSDAGDRMSLVEFVAQSPRLCAAHDKAGWVGLFARDAEINDPVGSAPHRGTGAISRFYDTFIAPNHIAFAVEHDVVCGMSVMRDLTLTSTMANGLSIPVPMHLRYDLVEEGGALRIRRLMAHWELPVLLRAQLGSWKGWLTSMQLTPQLLRHQGVSGLFGFMRGLGGHGRAARRTAEALLAALGRGDTAAAHACLDAGCTAESPPGVRVNPAELVRALNGARAGKLLGAGDYASATVHTSSGRGVLLCRFDARPARISHLELFL
jgi:hypothetical protein